MVCPVLDEAARGWAVGPHTVHHPTLLPTSSARRPCTAMIEGRRRERGREREREGGREGGKEREREREGGGGGGICIYTLVNT